MRSNINVFESLARGARNHHLYDYARAMDGVAAIVKYEPPNKTVLQHLIDFRSALKANLTFEWPSDESKAAWEDAIDLLDIDCTLLARLESEQNRSLKQNLSFEDK